MKRIRHTPEQIIRKLREADAELASGKTIPEVSKSLQGTSASDSEALTPRIDRLPFVSMPMAVRTARERTSPPCRTFSERASRIR